MQTQGREKGVGVLCLSYNQQRFKKWFSFALLLERDACWEGGILWNFSWWTVGRRGCKNRLKGRQGWAGYLLQFPLSVFQWQARWAISGFRMADQMIGVISECTYENIHFASSLWIWGLSMQQHYLPHPKACQVLPWFHFCFCDPLWQKAT